MRAAWLAVLVVVLPATAAAQDHSAHAAPPTATPPTATTAADPHAGHVMPAPAPTRVAPPVSADPHAGHVMPGPAQPIRVDPHAGHDMGAMTMGPPDTPTSADDAGRPAEAPPPAAALTGPAHAADAVFGAEAMAASRRILIHENGAVRTTMVLVDRLEIGAGDGEETFAWDAQAWTGGDINRLWLKAEGEGDLGGGVGESEVQALYSRAVSPFWDLQAGVRQDWRGDGEDATHLVLGVQGLAPHWWEIDAAMFLSTEGDLTARIEAEYDQRITQRLILQPRVEVDLAAEDAPERSISSGIDHIEAGVRLRYEVRREFAPYVGVAWTHDGEDDESGVEAVVGLRAWF